MGALVYTTEVRLTINSNDKLQTKEQLETYFKQSFRNQPLAERSNMLNNTSLLLKS